MKAWVEVVFRGLLHGWQMKADIRAGAAGLLLACVWSCAASDAPTGPAQVGVDHGDRGNRDDRGDADAVATFVKSTAQALLKPNCNCPPSRLSDGSKAWRTAVSLAPGAESCASVQQSLARSLNSYVADDGWSPFQASPVGEDSALSSAIETALRDSYSSFDEDAPLPPVRGERLAPTSFDSVAIILRDGEKISFHFWLLGVDCSWDHSKPGSSCVLRDNKRFVEGVTLSPEQASASCGGGSYCTSRSSPGGYAGFSATSGPMVLVPGGSFTMGCDSGSDFREPDEMQHVVEVGSFLIDVTEVTVKAYAECVEAGNCHEPKVGDYYNWNKPNHTKHPVNGVSFDDAQAYCGFVNKRLPTEAQWEKAAKGLEARDYPWGAEEATCQYAVMDVGAPGCGRRSTAEVKSKPGGASEYGVFDMAGNVSEWTASWSGPYPSSPTRGQSVTRVVRGGSWADKFSRLRVSDRHHVMPGVRDSAVGFRCVRTVQGL